MKLFKTAKKFGFAAMAILLATSLAFTGCSDGNDDNEDEKEKPPVEKPSDTDNKGDNDEGTTLKETVISSEPKEITWGSFLIIDGAKFEGTEPQDIIIEYDCVEVAGGDKGYTCFKIAANYENASLGKGKLSGDATLKNDDLGALDNTGDVGANGKKVIYTPTAEEWTLIKTGTNGLYINGNNIKITKVTLKEIKNTTSDDTTSDDTTGDNTTGDDTTGDDTTGDNTTGDNTTGDNTTGDNTTGDDTTGDDTTGDDTTGNDTTGDNTTGDNTTGDNTTGDNTTGDDEEEDNLELPEGATLLKKDLKLGWSGTDTICDNVANLKAGDVIAFQISGDPTQELQFIKKSWAGGLGDETAAVMDIRDSETNESVMYYSKGENATDPLDRPSVSLGANETTKACYFVVTSNFVALKDVAAVVGTATIDYMCLIPGEGDSEDTPPADNDENDDADNGDSGNSDEPFTYVAENGATFELPVNDWGTPGDDHGLQYHASASTIWGSKVPSAGEKYKIYMKGSITTDISNASVGFTKGWSWDDGAMEGSVSLTSESLSEGVEVTVTFKGTSGHDNLWIYTETTGLSATTLNLTEFKVTQVTE